MREEVLVLDHNVLDESFGESVYNSWKVISGVDLFTIVGYNLAVYKKIFFCPDVDLEAELKTVKKAKRKISIKYGKNIIYYIDDIELLNKLKGEEIEVGSYIIFYGDSNALDLIQNKSCAEIFASKELVESLMQSFDCFIEVHDNEWQSMYYYRDKSKWDNFLAYLKENANVKIVDDWSELPK